MFVSVFSGGGLARFQLIPGLIELYVTHELKLLDYKSADEYHDIYIKKVKEKDVTPDQPCNAGKRA